MESKQLEDICKNVDAIDEKIDIDNNLVDKGNEKMMTERKKLTKSKYDLYDFYQSYKSYLDFVSFF